MIAYLSLGTNLGDKEQNLRTAIDEIARLVGTVEAVSSFLATEPWGFVSSNGFLNAALRVQTELTPHQLLHVTQDIERRMGRTSKSVDGVYHDRIIDIDILLCDDMHISTPELTVPHPQMNERPFVLIPLNEILSKHTVQQ